MILAGTAASPGRAPVGDRPTRLAGERKLVTLRDAALCIAKLPKAEHDAEERQAAMQALLLVAEQDGPTVLAPTGMMRVLRRHEPKATPAMHAIPNYV